MDYPSGFFQKKYNEYKQQLNQYNLNNDVKHILAIQYMNILIYNIIKTYNQDIIADITKCFQLQNIINIILICLILEKPFTLFINEFKIDIKYQLSSKEKKVDKKLL